MNLVARRFERSGYSLDTTLFQLSTRAFAIRGRGSLARQRPLSDLENQGLIQAFEFTHELAWNVMKDYFAYQGNPSITGSRDSVLEAFDKRLVEDGEGWMEMIKSRNQTSYTYNRDIADAIVERILISYCVLFESFSRRMAGLTG